MKKENLALKYYLKNIAKISTMQMPLYLQQTFNNPTINVPTFGRTIKRNFKQ